MKKIYNVFVILLVLFSATNLFAQTASITWPLYDTTQLTSASVGNVTGPAESISAGSGQFGMSVFDYSTDGQRLWAGTAGWIAGSEEATRFIQFDALFTSGSNFIVSNVSFNYGAAGIDNNIKSNAYYSTDGWVTRTLLNPSPLAYPGSAMSPFTQNVSVTVPSGTTFSVRIYPYAVVNSSPMRPTFAVNNNVVISGTTAVKKNCTIQVSDIAGKWGKTVLLTAKLQETGAGGNINLPDRELKFYKIFQGTSDSDSIGVYINSGMTNANGEVIVMYDIPTRIAGQSEDSDSIAIIRAEFAGDANYFAQSSTGTLTIEKHVTSLTVLNKSGGLGETITLEAILTDNDMNKKGVSNRALVSVITIGEVNDPPEIIIESATTDVNGVASISYTMPSDSVSRSIRVSFAGDANYSAQSVTEKLTNKQKNSILQISNVSGKWGKSVTLSAKLQESDSLSTNNLPNQVLKFYQITMGSQAGDTKKVFINSGTTNENGMASVMYIIPSDSVVHKFDPQPSDSVSNSIRVEFAGDANYYAQSSTTKLTIQKHTTKIFVEVLSDSIGQSLMLKAVLSDSDSLANRIHNRGVEFFVNNKFVDSDSTNSSGAASVSYNIPVSSDSITYSISVLFTGDTAYETSEGTGTYIHKVVGIENNPNELPSKFELLQNYPNPFNPTSRIRFDLPKSSFVKISVYDILGKEIEVLVNEQKNSGTYEVVFNAKGLASGIYFYSIRAGDYSQSKKMILLR